MFNPQAHNVRFSTYAAYWIRNYIGRAIGKNSSLIRVPDYLSVLKSQLRRTLGDLRNRSGPGATATEPAPASAPVPHPEDREAAARLRIRPRQLKNLDFAMIERSSYHGISDNGNLTSLEEIVADPCPPDRELELVEDLRAVHAALDCLPPFEAWLIRQRFGLHGGDQPGDRRPRRRPARWSWAGPNPTVRSAWLAACRKGGFNGPRRSAAPSARLCFWRSLPSPDEEIA